MWSAKASKQVQPQKKSLFLISDQSSNLSYIYEHFELPQSEQQSTCLRYEQITLTPPIPSPNPSPSPSRLDVYIFPRNRQLKLYCELYNDILAKPDLILYAIDCESSINECIEWMNLFQKYRDRKIVFFSDAKTYLDRQRILTKVNTMFLRDISQNVLFPNIDGSAFQYCFENLGSIGASMEGYLRVMPAFSRFRWLWKRILDRTRLGQSSQSVI